MRAYQVIFDRRAQRHRIRKIAVTAETPTGFIRPGPVALWTSKTNTFRRLVDARKYLATKTA